MAVIWIEYLPHQPAVDGLLLLTDTATIEAILGFKKVKNMVHYPTDCQWDWGEARGKENQHLEVLLYK